MIDFNKICVVCGENDAKGFVKHCCGHVKGLCGDCDSSSERREIMHRKCGGCGGPLSPAEEKAQDEALVRAHEDTEYGMYDMIDDYPYDRPSLAEERILEAQREYDRSLQEHIANGSWDIDDDIREDTCGHVDVPKGRFVKSEKEDV